MLIYYIISADITKRLLYIGRHITQLSIEEVTKIYIMLTTNTNPNPFDVYKYPNITNNIVLAPTIKYSIEIYFSVTVRKFYS